MHTETHPDVFTVFDPEVTRPHFEGLLASDDAFIWVAEVEGEAVGYVWANLMHREATELVHEQRALHVQALAVAPRARIPVKAECPGVSRKVIFFRSPSFVLCATS